MAKQINNCVYLHVNPIKQEIFYVGVGTEERPYTKTNARKYFKKRMA